MTLTTEQRKQTLDDFLNSPRFIDTVRPTHNVLAELLDETTVSRSYAGTVLALRGSRDRIFEDSLRGAVKLHELIELARETGGIVPSIGAYDATTARSLILAGLPAIYLSGWQVAAAANTSGMIFPDQSIYPVDSVPKVVKEIVNMQYRADQVESVGGGVTRDWFAPVWADMEAGFGGLPNVYQLTMALIEAGAAGVHLEDQLSSAKKCGHMGGKVIVPMGEHIRKLQEIRLAADVAGVPLVIIGRTDAGSATHITSDIYGEAAVEREFGHLYNSNTALRGAIRPDTDFVDYSQGRDSAGFYALKGGKGGIEMCIQRGLAFAPYSDLLWMETSKADLNEARKFAGGIHAVYPGKMLAYNCSPSFNWEASGMSPQQVAEFQKELGKMGYVMPFSTLPLWHLVQQDVLEFGRAFMQEGMLPYLSVQRRERLTNSPFRIHQTYVGAGVFDAAVLAVDPSSNTLAVKGSTEVQFGTNNQKPTN